MTGAGDLRYRVRFDARAADANAAGGGTVTDWVEQFTHWASIQRLRGGETVLGQRMTGITPVLIKVRFDRETRKITSAWRAVEVSDDGTEVSYNIRNAADMDTPPREWITVLAEQGPANG